MGGYKCELSPELQEIARKELHEDPSRREKDIEHIRDWLKKQPHITARTGIYKSYITSSMYYVLMIDSFR